MCDRVVLRLLPILGVRLNEPIPPGAMLQVQRLRLPLAVCTMTLAAAGTLQIWCLVEGCIFLLKGLPGECEGMRQWLAAYCLSLAMVPFANLVAIAAQVWWITGGSANVVSDQCQEVAPYLKVFVKDVQLRGLWTLAILVIFSFALVGVRRFQISLRETWASGAPTLQRVINAVMQAPEVEVPPDTECAICLESEEGAWRALPCEHVFHKDCLLRWLRCGRRCPLCRMDLHRAFLDTGGTGDARLEPSASAESTQLTTPG